MRRFAHSSGRARHSGEPHGPRSNHGDGGLDPDPDSDLTTRTRVLRVVPITLLFLVIAGALVLAMLDHWRRASAVMAVAAALGAVLRLVLPGRLAGVLAVRSRAFDVIFLAAIAILLGAMAVAVATPQS